MMKIITQIKVEPEDPQELLQMMMRFNQVCNYLSERVFCEELWHWLPLQRRTYHIVRHDFDTTAAETVVAIRKTAYAYRNKNRRDRIVEFRLKGSMPLFKHVYRDGVVRIYGHEFSVIARPGVELPRHPKEGMLSYRNGRFFIHQVIEVDLPEPYEPVGYLGCDLGIKNILVDNDGVIYSGGRLNGLRKRHAKLRAKLQSKGTRSARRLLNRRRNKESRFARDVNHVISKRVVEKASTATLGIALEDLKGIRERIKVRKADRRQHSSWGFNQLRLFITYKAGLSGVPVVSVDARNTSRTCPECGCIDKRNRPRQSDFLCIECGFGQHADTVAARNIAGRVDGKLPDAPSQEDVQVLSGSYVS